MGFYFRRNLAIIIAVFLVGCSDNEQGQPDARTDDARSVTDTDGLDTDGSDTRTISDTHREDGVDDTSLGVDGNSDDIVADDTNSDSNEPDTPTNSVPQRFDFCDGSANGTVINATPDNYKSKLSTMSAGDTLKLAAGTYPDGLSIFDMNGSEGSCFIIDGESAGGPVVFTGKSGRNTVSIKNSSYVVVRNIELAGQGKDVDAVKAEGNSDYAHHIVLDNLHIHDFDHQRGNVGISTKCPAWRWVIRNNRIENTGTGLYLGNSPGDRPFIDGLIEHNVVLDTLGYNMEIKHQNARPDLDGIPQSGTTIIRHNVFSKSNNADTAGARPNLLVGHFPSSGPGADDQYLIYGNFFWDNPTEALFQGEGNVALYNNVMINPNGPAARIQPHNDVPRRIAVFFNTIIAEDRGLLITGGDPNFDQLGAGNAIFAGRPIKVEDGAAERDNVTDSMEVASDSLVAPTEPPGGGLDVHPERDSLQGAVDTAGLDSFVDWNRDFDSAPRDATRIGAYARPAEASSWPVDRARKP